MSGSSAGVVVKPWMQQRPWRNSNPGNLRVRSRAPVWPMQAAVDDGVGGPFAIFATRSDGWCALGLWLFLAHDEWGWRTPARMISAFAPPRENDTNQYIDLVCRTCGVGSGDVVDVHDRIVRRALMRAIALAEGGPRVEWPEAEVEAGLILTEGRWGGFLEAYRGGAVPTSGLRVARLSDASDPRDASADDLNKAELDKLG